MRSRRPSSRLWIRIASFCPSLARGWGSYCAGIGYRSPAGLTGLGGFWGHLGLWRPPLPTGADSSRSARNPTSNSLPERKRFTVVDLALVASATIIGLTSARYTMVSLVELSRRPVPTTFRRQEWETGIACVLIAWTLALVIARFRFPRPDFDHLGVQPGFVANCSVLLTVAIGIVWAALYGSTGSPLAMELVPILNFYRMIFTLGGAWLAMILCRRWRPEPCWIDRCGRIVGICWFVMTAWAFWL
jgi:hypothetical protein